LVQAIQLSKEKLWLEKQEQKAAAEAKAALEAEIANEAANNADSKEAK